MAKLVFPIKNILTFFLTWTLLLSLCSCGNLNTFQSQWVPLISKGDKVFLSSNFCNRKKCQAQESKLHSRLIKIIEGQLNSMGLKIINQKEHARYSFILISAFEEEIVEDMPRNVYLIILDSKGKELSQFGISEHFSDPMTSQYMVPGKVEKVFRKLLAQSFNTPYYLADLEGKRDQ